MLLAFNQTIDWLETVFGTDDPNQWIWGALHQLQFTHLSGLDAFNVGPLPGDGEGYTVNPSGANIDEDGGIAQGGASERLIVDLSDLGNSISVIPSGQSGHPYQKHYSDQLTELFLQGKYHSQYYDYTISDFEMIESTLIFRPVGGRF
jgi:penicillin amidase